MQKEAEKKRNRREALHRLGEEARRIREEIEVDDAEENAEVKAEENAKVIVVDDAEIIIVEDDDVVIID